VLFHFTNEHEKNIILSEVSHCHNINEKASSLAQFYNQILETKQAKLHAYQQDYAQLK